MAKEKKRKKKGGLDVKLGEYKKYKPDIGVRPPSRGKPLPPGRHGIPEEWSTPKPPGGRVGPVPGPGGVPFKPPKTRPPIGPGGEKPRPKPRPAVPGGIRGGRQTQPRRTTARPAGMRQMKRARPKPAKAPARRRPKTLGAMRRATRRR